MTVNLRISESAWQDKVMDLAHIYLWKVAHFRPARTETGWRTAVSGEGKGFPDLILVHPNGGVLFRELKAQGRRLTAEQELWGQWLTEAGGDWRVWEPSDWELAMATLAIGSVKR